MAPPEPCPHPHRMSISHAKGLMNLPGQNNCFLNSAVQVLWHLDIFRRSFRELSGHACMADSCIFCALKELFNQFQYSQETALPPDALRFALAEAFSDQRRFQLGFMDDAAECFENILLRIHCHIANKDTEEMCNVNHCLPHCIPHQKFAMNLIEQIVCHACGATSEPFPFTQMVHYVSTPALCIQAKQYDREIGMSFGELLKRAGAVGDIRDCPRSCGAKIQIKKSLINKPDIVSIGLVWDSERPTIKHIMNVFRAIGTTLRILDVFDTVNECREPLPNVLQLVGLVTYYGKHYSTFFFHTKLREWIYFDDAAVRAIGPHWEQVVDKCIRGHFQPLLLLYANPNGTPVNTENAPKEITPLIVNRSIRRSFSSTLQAKCDQSLQSNKYHSIQSMPKAAAPQLPHISSDTEPNNHSVIPYIDNVNMDAVRHLNRQKLANKLLPQQCNYENVKPLLSSLSMGHKINFNHRPNKSNDLLNYDTVDGVVKPSFQSGSSDVPDSPSSKSSLSYFSDIGELDNGYISRKTVESILSLQRHSLKKKAGNRNSSSSLDSFDLRNGTMMSNNAFPNERPSVCSLQRHDSGNSSGDRNSGSSASVSSVESPYYSLKAANRRMFNNQKHPWNQLISDQGYDSFSLSSTDSYPSIVGPSSPGKLNMRLTQIPEDVQLMELIKTSTMLDCDKLCSEADILLLKSHEKEREGDLRAAAALCDSAAQKARSAMDAPYSNHQTLITAKMKHSMCVMRSASLHKRVKELEIEEKRRMKAEQLASSVSIGEHHHSRQSSRDSTHSRHSRQGSKDSKDGKSKEFITKHASLEMNKSKINEGVIAAGKTLEIYATLPKKGSKKKFFQQSLNSLSSLRIKNNEEGSGSLYKDFIFKRNSVPNIVTDPQILSKKKNENSKKISLNANERVNQTKQEKSDFINCVRDSDFSDYYSEWEGTRKALTPLSRTFSGSASCRENDSEYYGEVGQYGTQSSGKKQHRVRRKLLMGGFMRRKNRSLPDLREGLKSGQNEQNNNPQTISHDDSTPCKTIAQISSKGFHQTHRAFISEHGLYQRPSLLKVNPPHIEKSSKQYQPTQQSPIEKSKILNLFNDYKNTTNYSPNDCKPKSTSLSTFSSPDYQLKSFNSLKLSPSDHISKTANFTAIDNQSKTSISSKLSSNNSIVCSNSLNSCPTDRKTVTPNENRNSAMISSTNEQQLTEINKTSGMSFLKELSLKRAEIMKNNDKLKLESQQNIKDNLTQASTNISSSNSKVSLSTLSSIDGDIERHNSLSYRLQNAKIIANQNINSITLKNNCTQQTTYSKASINGVNKPVTKLNEINLDQIQDSNSLKNSVKDLASRFEKIMIKKQEESQAAANSDQTTDKLESNQEKPSNDSVCTVDGISNNDDSNLQMPSVKPTVFHSLDNKRSVDNYLMQSSIPLPTKSAIPLNSNCSSPSIRPNKPPDYQTAIKRIEMLRNDKKGVVDAFSQPFYANVSPNITQHQSSRCPQMQTLMTSQQKLISETPKSLPLDIGSEQIKQPLNKETNSLSLTRKKNGFKKSVSFSDQVVLVACAEDEEEEFLPNPLLERILGKNNGNNGQQSV